MNETSIHYKNSQWTSNWWNCLNLVPSIYKKKKNLQLTSYLTVRDRRDWTLSFKTGNRVMISPLSHLWLTLRNKTVFINKLHNIIRNKSYEDWKGRNKTVFIHRLHIYLCRKSQKSIQTEWVQKSQDTRAIYKSQSLPYIQTIKNLNFSFFKKQYHLQ